MSPFPTLTETEPLPEPPTVPQTGAPTLRPASGFAGFTQRAGAPAGVPAPPEQPFDEKRTRDMLSLSAELGVAADEIEPMYEALRLELDFYKTHQLQDPHVMSDNAEWVLQQNNKIGLREQVARMDVSDWAKRGAFNPEASAELYDLHAAIGRLGADGYSPETVASWNPFRFRSGWDYAEQASTAAPTGEALKARDMALVTQYFLEQQEIAERGQTWGAKVFDGASYLPAWMIEFALTGGLNKLGSKGAQEIGLRTLRGYAKTAGGRAVLKAAGWTGGAITRATLGMPHRLTEEVLQRRVNQFDLADGRVIEVRPEAWATSILKGYGQHLIEVASESAGEGIVKGGAWISRKTLGKLPFTQALFDRMKTVYLANHLGPGASAEFTERFFDAAQFSGLLGEYEEERLATILTAVTGTQDFGLGPDSTPLQRLQAGLTNDLKNLSVEATVLAIPGSVRLGARALTPAANQSGVKEGWTDESTESVPDLAAAAAPSPAEARPGQTVATGPSPDTATEAAVQPDALPANAPVIVSGTFYHNTDSEAADSILSSGFRVEDTSNLSPAERGFAAGNLGDGVYVSPDYTDTMNAWGGESNIRVRPIRPLKLLSLGTESGAASIKLVVADDAKAHGYDGLIVNDPHPHSGGLQIVVFDPALLEPIEVLDDANLGPTESRDMTIRLDAGAQGASDDAVTSFPDLDGPFPQGQEEGLAAPERDVPPLSIQELVDYVIQPRGRDALIEQFKAAHPDIAAVDRDFRTWAWGRLPKAVKDRLKALRFKAVDQAPTEETPIEDLDLPNLERLAIQWAVNRTLGIEQVQETETRRVLHDQAAIETAEDIREFFGQAPPADLPETGPPEPSAGDIGFIRGFLTNLGLLDPIGYEKYSDKDLGEFWKYLQFPDDLRRSFPQFNAVYEAQRARELEKQVLDHYFAAKIEPFTRLSPRDQRTVMQYGHMQEQDPAGYEHHWSKATEAQKTGYKALRLGLDEAAEMLIAEMQNLGMKEEWIEEFRARVGRYMPHKWRGGHRVVVKAPQTAEQVAQHERARTVEMTGVPWSRVESEVRRLQAKYPGHTVFSLKASKMPMDAFQDIEFVGTQHMVDRVVELANTRAGLTGGVSAEQEVIIRDAFKDLWKSKGFGSHFIHRQETPGYAQDDPRDAIQYFAGFTGYLTKMRACLQFGGALAQIDGGRTPNLYKYASGYVRYVTGESYEFHQAKSLAYYWYLYGNIKSAVVNMSGNFTMGWPVLSKHTNRSLAKLMAAGGKVAAGRLDEGEKAFLTALEAEGLLDPQMAVELSAQGGNAIYRVAIGKGKKVTTWFDFFGKAETWNRRSMAIALYHSGYDSLETANLNTVAEIIEEAHHRFSKGNRPAVSRGLLSPLTTFRSYTLHYMTWVKNEIKAKRLPPLARSMAALTIVGGLKSLPFMGLGAGVFALWRQWFDSDPEAEARQALGETAEAMGLPRGLGEKTSDLVMRGLPSAAGVTLTGSVAMQDIVPSTEPGQSLWEATTQWASGLFGDVPARVARVQASLRAGDKLRALEDASPEFLRNPLAARRMHTQGQATRSGRPILDHEHHQQLKLTEWERILKSAGFQPDRLSKQYQIKELLDEIYVKQQALKAQWADRLVLAGQSNDLKGIQEIFGELDAYNKKQLARGRVDLTIAPDDLNSAINSRLQPIGLPPESMMDTYHRIWQQFYGAPKKEN